MISKSAVNKQINTIIRNEAIKIDPNAAQLFFDETGHNKSTHKAISSLKVKNNLIIDLLKIRDHVNSLEKGDDIQEYLDTTNYNDYVDAFEAEQEYSPLDKGKVIELVKKTDPVKFTKAIVESTIKRYFVDYVAETKIYPHESAYIRLSNTMHELRTKMDNFLDTYGMTE